MIARAERIKEVDMALGRRGIGRSRAVILGKRFSEREGKEGELWTQGLGRARNATEREDVWRAIGIRPLGMPDEHFTVILGLW